jgi:hypothetical protein
VDALHHELSVVGAQLVHLRDWEAGGVDVLEDARLAREAAPVARAAQHERAVVTELEDVAVTPAGDQLAGFVHISSLAQTTPGAPAGTCVPLGLFSKQLGDVPVPGAATLTLPADKVKVDDDEQREGREADDWPGSPS